VILAGGRGTRLAPLTDTRSKAMVEFHGKPFAEYLIELARSQGFERFLFLLGYQPASVSDYFGDGRRWGVRIDYSVTPVEDETGARVREALPRLDPSVLLMTTTGRCLSMPCGSGSAPAKRWPW
jgi:NDP-sugar pyrophosphorylase family protein